MMERLKNYRKKPEGSLSYSDRSYAPKRTNLEDDAIQIHNDGEILSEKLETKKQRLNNKFQKPISNIYGIIPYTQNLCSTSSPNYLMNVVCTMWNRKKGSPEPKVIHEPSR